MTLNELDALVQNESHIYGYRMKYPTPEEVRYFMREVSWDERFEVLSQGFHRGCYQEQCYSLSELTAYVAKRNPRNPTGGVRFIEGDDLVQWIMNSIGDIELAKAIYKCYRTGDPAQIITDTVRNLLTVRMNQFSEVLVEEYADKEECL